MAAPNLSAAVPANQRFRVLYRLTSPLRALFSGADERITEAWQGSSLAVVIAPATAPDVGGTTRLTGPLEAFTSIDIKSLHAMPSVTWDTYLAPFRRPSLGLLGLGVNAELRSVELLAPAQLSTTVAPAARTTATQTPAAVSREAATSPGELLARLGAWANSAANRALLLALLALLIVLAWQFGPELARRWKARPS
jgi:hypothetical protein